MNFKDLHVVESKSFEMNELQTFGVSSYYVGWIGVLCLCVITPSLQPVGGVLVFFWVDYHYLGRCYEIKPVLWTIIDVSRIGWGPYHNTT